MKKIFILTLFITSLFLPSDSFAKTPKEPEKTIEYLNIKWWEKFEDDNLTKNLITVYHNNYDLKNTTLKIQESEKLVKMQFAQELPSLNFSGEVIRNLQAPRQQFGNMVIPKYSQYNYYLPLTASYEIDIWGTNRLKTQSQKEQLEIIKQAQKATYITITSNFATDYFNLIKADKMLDIQEELVNIQEKIVALITEKYQIGLCSINDVLYEEKFLTTLKEERNRHKLTKELLQETLKVYLVNQEGDIPHNNYEDVIILQNIPQEYSSTIIENRPDFKQEEANIKRIGFDVQIAKREFLPKFNIFGQIGLNAYHLSSMFNSPSQFFNAGILPSIDLFSGGRKIAFLKLKKYQYQEALNDYQKTILEGIKEINSGLLEYKTAINNYTECSNRLKTQNKIYNLTKEKNIIGTSNSLDLLYAKESYLITQKEEVSSKINSLISIIGLYKATGGVDLYKLNEKSL